VVAILAATASVAVSVVGLQRVDRLAESLAALRAEARLDEWDDRAGDLEREVDSIASGLLDGSHVVSTASRSVVTVLCGGAQGSGFSYEVRLPEPYQAAILTNHHVVEDCTYTDGPNPAVQLAGDTYDGDLWSWDSDQDLALIMVREWIAPLREASRPSLGDPVITIGSPHGFDGTVSRGIVSRLFADGLMTDAAIDSGNSGGPLLDRNGDVLGVTTLTVFDADALHFSVGIWEACGAILDCPRL
jgi:S1-C subfamily serine protease